MDYLNNVLYCEPTALRPTYHELHVHISWLHFINMDCAAFFILR